MAQMALDGIPIFISGQLNGFADGVAEVAVIILTQWRLHFPELLPYVAFWFMLHAIVEYGIPTVFGAGVFDFLGRDGKVTDRKLLAKDARTKVIAVVQAVYVTAASIYGLMTPGQWAKLRVDPYASTWLTQHLCKIAASFFLWDVVIVNLDGYPFEFHVHAWLAFSVFSAALHPFIHHMGLVSLLFEASTPFLHLRKGLIQSGNGSGACFNVTQFLFATTFFLVRIVWGYYECWLWQLQMVELLRNGSPHSRPVIYMYFVSCVTSCGLNAMWMWQIISAGFRKGKRGKAAAMKKLE